MAKNNLNVNGALRSVGAVADRRKSKTGICIMRRISTRKDTKLYHELIGVQQAGCAGGFKSTGGMNGFPIVACEKHLEEIKIAQHILRLPKSR